MSSTHTTKKDRNYLIQKIAELLDKEQKLRSAVENIRKGGEGFIELRMCDTLWSRPFCTTLSYLDDEEAISILEAKADLIKEEMEELKNGL